MCDSSKNTTQNYTFLLLGHKNIKSRLKLSGLCSFTIWENFGQQLSHTTSPQTWWMKAFIISNVSVVGRPSWVLCPRGRHTTSKCELRLRAHRTLSVRFQISQVVGRIQFLAVTVLRFLFLCWLWAGGGSQLAEATHRSWHLASHDDSWVLQSQQKSLSLVCHCWSFYNVHSHRCNDPIIFTGLPTLEDRRFYRVSIAGADSWKPSQNSACHRNSESLWKLENVLRASLSSSHSRNLSHLLNEPRFPCCPSTSNSLKPSYLTSGILKGFSSLGSTENQI